MRIAVLDATTLQELVSAAVAAPSIHNTQPWRFRLDPDALTLEIRAARRRGLRHVDPAGRALHLSVGCAVLNLDRDRVLLLGTGAPAAPTPRRAGPAGHHASGRQRQDVLAHLAVGVGPE